MMPAHAALQPPGKQQLLKDGAALEDARKLADLKIENDDTLAMCFQQSGGPPGLGQDARGQQGAGHGGQCMALAWHGVKHEHPDQDRHAMPQQAQRSTMQMAQHFLGLPTWRIACARMHCRHQCRCAPADGTFEPINITTFDTAGNEIQQAGA